MHENGFPAALARDYTAACAAFEHKELRRDDLPDEWDSISDHGLYEQEKRQRRSKEPTLRANDDWQRAVCCLANTFFPALDFPILSDSEEHPATAFLGWAIGSPKLRTLHDRIETLIALQLNVAEAIWPEDDLLLVLGMYPGITARDIRDAATEIADRVNRRYGDRLPRTRIRTLRSEGFNQREIGDRLGLSQRAVKDALALDDVMENSPP